VGLYSLGGIIFTRWVYIHQVGFYSVAGFIFIRWVYIHYMEKLPT